MYNLSIENHKIHFPSINKRMLALHFYDHPRLRACGPQRPEVQLCLLGQGKESTTAGPASSSRDLFSVSYIQSFQKWNSCQGDRARSYCIGVSETHQGMRGQWAISKFYALHGSHKSGHRGETSPISSSSFPWKLAETRILLNTKIVRYACHQKVSTALPGPLVRWRARDFDRSIQQSLAEYKNGLGRKCLQ